MQKFNEFSQLVSNFSDVADFLTIYIEEAHPREGWVLEDNIDLAKHKSLNDRLAAGKMLMQYNSVSQIVVDNMNGDANSIYGGRPERLVIIYENRIAYEGKRGPQGYSLNKVKDWLVQHTGRYDSADSAELENKDCAS